MGEYKHRLSKHPLYSVWQCMKNRCYRKKTKGYEFYGGRGVTVCDLWKNDFKPFHDWCIANGWKPGLQLDKDIIPLKLGIPAVIYSPEMCSIATRKENANSKRNNRIIEFNGKSQTLAQWRDETGIDSNVIFNRIFKYGYSIEKALSNVNNNRKGYKRRRSGLVYKSTPSPLTKEQVIEMRVLHAKGNISYSEVGRLYGVSKQSATGIIKRETWRHVE